MRSAGNMPRQPHELPAAHIIAALNFTEQRMPNLLLADLTDEIQRNVQQALQDDLLTEGHARALLSLNSARSIEAALETVLNLGLNVRQTELFVNKLLGKAPRKQTKKKKSAEIQALENKLRRFFNTKVNLQSGKKGGSITIFFYSDEELTNITDSLGLND